MNISAVSRYDDTVATGSAMDTLSNPYDSAHGSISMHTDETEPDSDQREFIRLSRRALHVAFDSNHFEAILAEHCPPEFQPPAFDFANNFSSAHASYTPLAKYLNDCLQQTRIAYESDEQFKHCAMDYLFTPRFRWFEYNKLAVNVDSVTRKVDIAGCIVSEGCELGRGNQKQHPDCVVLPDETYVDWAHMVSFVEVKDKWPEMITQTVLYARRIFANQPYRSSVRFILFSHSGSFAAIAELDHGGLYLTRPYALGEEDSFNRFSFLLAGMYCSSTDAHGYNRRMKPYCIPKATPEVTTLDIWSLGAGFLRMSRCLCNRVDWVARCTHAYLLARSDCNSVPYKKVSGISTHSDDEKTFARTRYAPLVRNLLDNEFAEYTTQRSESCECVPVSDFESRSKKRKLEALYPRDPAITSELPDLNGLPPPPIVALNEVPEDEWENVVEVSAWIHHAHRNDSERKVVRDLVMLRREEWIVFGIPMFGQRLEGRVTLAATSAAGESRGPNYYYTNAYIMGEDDIPKQHEKDTAEQVTTTLKERGYKASNSRKQLGSLVKSIYRSGPLPDLPQPRQEEIQKIKDVGGSLLTVKDDELVACVYEAMLGYRSLLRLGYVHRDISVDNIIVVDKKDAAANRSGYKVVHVIQTLEAGQSAAIGNDIVNIEGLRVEVQKVEEAEPSSHFKRGMLIDLSLAIKRVLEQGTKTGHPRLTGTRTFMAMHILRGEDELWIRHSPIFDMESFFWTLVFVPLYRAFDGGTATRDDKENFRRMRPSEGVRWLEIDADMKGVLMYRILEGVPEDSCLKGYEGLLVPLAELVNKYYRDAEKLAAKKLVFNSATEDEAVDTYIMVVQKYLRSKGIPCVDVKGTHQHRYYC